MNLCRSLSVAASLALAPALAGCAASGHPAVAAALGAPRPSASLDAVVDQPGPLTVETVVGAAWHVPRSGLLNLDNPKAKAAGLTDGEVPVFVMFHAIRHPTRGLWLVDTGAERALRDDPGHAAVRGLVASYANIGDMRVYTDTASWIAKQNEPVRGVFMTHLHIDHVSGMRDIPANVPIYTGPGEASAKDFLHLFTSGIVNDALDGKGPLQELRFERDPGGEFEGVLDVFGDGSLWALWVPGHTPGSLAFVARTKEGPVLLTGDACHTAWGWVHGVEPGGFTEDPRRGVESLERLERFAAKHPSMDVRLGHQWLGHAKDAPP
jgi:glyoxylase-like metal-dependent hydrolase (beta-lactamase superfamily II)